MRINSLAAACFLAVLVIAQCLGAARSVAEAQVVVDTPGAFVPGEVLVKYAPGISRTDLDSMRARFGMTMLELIPGIDVYRMRLPPGMSANAMIANCTLDARCQYVEPNYLGGGGDVIPDDPHFPVQWHHHNEGQTSGVFDADIDAVEGWQIASGRSSVVVAVLDTGIDFAHPEFQGRVLPGYDFVNQDDDPQADHPHGVLVAGILAANAGNGFGVAGVDHGASLLPIKVLDSRNVGTTSALAQGLIYAAGAHVINMSLINYPLSQTLLSALQFARDAGSVLIACAGNGGIGNADQSGPGASPLTISVGATDHTDARAPFSATGVALDVVAPGLGVATVSPDGSDAAANFNGCSAATPIASGIASILLSVDPRLTHDDVQTVLQESADDLAGGEDAQEWDEFFGHGRVNLNAALESIVPGERVVPIDIRPYGPLNQIDPGSPKSVPVAILSADAFDAGAVLVSSVRFGPTGTEAEAVRDVVGDVDSNGTPDMILHFSIPATGIQCGDTWAILRGRMSDGTLIQGFDVIRTVGCR
jgi:subtilisin family serine protease